METGWSGISIPPNQTAVRGGNAVKTKRHFGFWFLVFKREKMEKGPMQIDMLSNPWLGYEVTDE